MIVYVKLEIIVDTFTMSCINSSAWEFLPEKGHHQPKGVPPALSQFLPLFLSWLP